MFNFFQKIKKSDKKVAFWNEKKNTVRAPPSASPAGAAARITRRTWPAPRISERIQLLGYGYDEKKSSYARGNSGNSVIFKRSALGRLEFYKKPNKKIRLEQKMI